MTCLAREIDDAYFQNTALHFCKFVVCRVTTCPGNRVIPQEFDSGKVQELTKSRGIVRGKILSLFTSHFWQPTLMFSSTVME